MLNKIELDITLAGGCQDPTCKDPLCGTEFYFHARCHPDAGLWVSYKKDPGVLVITCRRCSKRVAEVKVGE